jgi:hypothetical protein
MHWTEYRHYYWIWLHWKWYCPYWWSVFMNGEHILHWRTWLWNTHSHR